ncbi:uncharacterized protein LOC121952711 [Plectropomus leopardus]|uniref:uncharacterized protein LOC121952711 n=1 Tax=Plectropomus leopardus TaxID=160734 RepID=UPI001C4CD242|nr:uncharacterized protein LOC121952711 [Plectropomus leopardus]
MQSLLLGREKKEEEAGFGIDLGLSPGFAPHAATMFSCVGCFWVLLSSALVAVCSFSFISPAWIVKDQLRNSHHQQHQQHQQHQHGGSKDSVSFGLLWHCSESLDHMYRCYTFGGLGKFAEIPSSSWQVSKTNTPITSSPAQVRGAEHEGRPGRELTGRQRAKFDLCVISLRFTHATDSVSGSGYELLFRVVAFAWTALPSSAAGAQEHGAVLMGRRQAGRAAASV